MKTCDLCGGQTKNLWLIPEEYQIDKIIRLCESCAKEFNGVCSRAHRIQHTLAERQKKAATKEWLAQRHFSRLTFEQQKEKKS